MAIRTYVANAPSVAQVDRLTVPKSQWLENKISENSRLRVTINGKVLEAVVPTSESEGGYFDGIDDSLAAGVLLQDLKSKWDACQYPEFREIIASRPFQDESGDWIMDFTATVPGVPFTMAVSSVYPAVDVDFISGYVDGEDEVQQMHFVPSPTSGTFTITWNFGSGDETSDPIPAGSSAATVKAKILGGMSTPTEGGIDVSGSGTAADPYMFTLSSTLLSVNPGILTANVSLLSGPVSIDVDEYQSPGADTNEVQAVWISKHIPYDVDASALSGYLTVRVSVDGGSAWSAWSSSITTSRIQQLFASLGVATQVNLQTNGSLEVDCHAFSIVFTGDTDPHELVRVEWRYYEVEFGSTVLDSGNATVRRITTGGSSSKNEVIMLRQSTYYQASTWNYGEISFTHDGNTATLSQGDDVISEIEALSSVASGGVQIHAKSKVYTSGYDLGDESSYGDIVFLEFIGDESATDQPVTTNTTSVISVVNGDALGDQIQSIVVNATSGTFTLTFPGESATADIAFGATASAVELALETAGLPAGATITVTGTGTSGDPYLVAMGGTLSGTAVADITGSAANLVYSATVVKSTVAQGKPTTGEKWSVAINGATGGNIVLTYRGKSATVAYNASAETLEAAMEALSTVISATVTGSGTVASPWELTLVGPDTNITYLIANNSSLTGSSVLEYTHTEEYVESEGPWHWEHPLNWKNAGTGEYGIPENGDELVFEQGSGERCPKYDLDQSSLTVTEIHISGNFTDQAQIGLTRWNELGYLEYRDTELKIKLSNKNVIIGARGNGGSPLLNINTLDTETNLLIHMTGSPLKGEFRAVQFQGTHADNTVYVLDGSFAAAPYAGQSATISHLTQRGGLVLLSEGSTVGDIDKTAGEIEMDRANVSGTLSISG